MKTPLYAIVPGESEEEAIENGHKAFYELCHDGTVPLFEYYIMFAEHEEAESPGVYPTSKPETVEKTWSVWEHDMERIPELADGESDTHTLGRASRSREYCIYDHASRPVLTGGHLKNLIEPDDNWVVCGKGSY
jgi:hypothetical protein